MMEAQVFKCWQHDVKTFKVFRRKEEGVDVADYMILNDELFRATKMGRNNCHALPKKHEEDMTFTYGKSPLPK